MLCLIADVNYMIAVLLALASLLKGRSKSDARIPDESWKSALWLLGFTTVVFRVEVILLWIPVSLQLLLLGRASFYSIITTNFAAAATAAVASH